MFALASHPSTFASGSGARRASPRARELTRDWLASERYRVERLFAWGGMGLVYEATHLVLDMHVALKVLRPEFGDCDEHVAAFLDEAHWLAALSSDHIVRVLDAGRLATGLPFVAMERLDGRDLRCVLDACGRLAPSVVVQYGLQLCSALSEVHRIGLIHCDVKPSNLFLAASRGAPARIKLLDFGIARTTGGSDPRWSSSELIVGSPLYSSPEQLRADPRLDCRTDIWSLGLVLFEMLTGVRPFAASTIAETQARVLFDPTPHLRDFRPELDSGLAAAIETCLQKDRHQRFSSVDDLSAALQRFSA